MENQAGSTRSDPIRYHNVAVHLSRLACKKPDETAICYPTGTSRTSRNGRILYSRMTWRELDGISNRIASGLLEYGIPAAARVALMVTPSPEFFALTFALLKSGIVPVMVDPGMGAAKLKKCLAEAEPFGFIGIPKAHLARILLGWSRKTIQKTVTVFPKGFSWGKSLQAVMKAGSDAPFFKPLDPGFCESTRPDDIAAINFTSGSTGVPKGVIYTHGIFAAQVDLIRNTYGIEPGEIDLCTFPLFALFAPALGMTAVIPRMDFTRPAAVDPRNIIQAADDFGPTNMFGSPALLNAVGRYCAPRNITFPTLRRVICAGAPINPSILRWFTPALTGDARVFSGYGATEAMPLASIDSRTILSETSHSTDSGGGVCVGVANQGIDLDVIAITDEPVETWSDSCSLKPGKIGEITARGPVVTQAYFNRKHADRLAKIFDPGTGCYRHRMGDLGYFDDKGRLWFCGRKSHRVQTANGDLYTTPTEGVFNAHPEVFRTALVGIGSPGNETPVLCVELESGGEPGSSDAMNAGTATADNANRIFRELREIAMRYPHTQTICRFILHRSFPVDIRHNSKIFREKLKDWVMQHQKKIVTFNIVNGDLP